MSFPLFYVIICAQYKNCEGSNERVRYLLFNSMLVLYLIEIKLFIEYVYDDSHVEREIELLFFLFCSIIIPRILNVTKKMSAAVACQIQNQVNRYAVRKKRRAINYKI